MKISRNVGTVNQVLDIFVQDATVSTGAGLANVVGSSVSFSWWHGGQASVSTGTASTAGSMGVFSTSAWVQVSSSQALGWYQFGAPNGVFAAGDSAHIHFYGAPSMAPVPVEIDLNTQVNVVDIQGANAATTSAGVLQVSTQALGTAAVNVVQIQGANAVTSSAGVLQTSTQALSYSVNVTSIVGTPAVTSAGGTLNVSTQALRYSVNVTSISGTASVGAPGYVGIDWASITNTSAVQTLSNTAFSSVAVTVGSVDVSSFAGSPVVTSSAGVLQVSTQALVYSGYALTAAYDAAKTAAQAGDAMALTAAERATLAGVVLTTTQPESIRASSSAGNIIQLQYEILANLIEASNSGTTRTLGSVTSHALGAVQYQYDSTTPSAITRIA